MSGASRKKNKLIREQCPGGAETLAALELMNKISQRHEEQTEPGKISRLAETEITKIKTAMVAQVKEWRGDEA